MGQWRWGGGGEGKKKPPVLFRFYFFFRFGFVDGEYLCGGFKIILEGWGGGRSSNGLGGSGGGRGGGFLEGRTEEQLATVVGVDQSTVSRRIKKGVEELRKHLRQSGLAIEAGVLTSVLAQQSAQTTPASLTASLGKMALAGVGRSKAAL